MCSLSHFSAFEQGLFIRLYIDIYIHTRNKKRKWMVMKGDHFLCFVVMVCISIVLFLVSHQLGNLPVFITGQLKVFLLNGKCSQEHQRINQKKSLLHFHFHSVLLHSYRTSCYLYPIHAFIKINPRIATNSSGSWTESRFLNTTRN